MTWVAPKFVNASYAHGDMQYHTSTKRENAEFLASILRPILTVVAIVNKWRCWTEVLLYYFADKNSNVACCILAVRNACDKPTDQ